MILPTKRGTNLQTKHREVRHMSRPRFFYMGLLYSNSKPAFLNVCGLHISKQLCLVPFMRRPHKFENIGFKMKIGGPNESWP